MASNFPQAGRPKAYGLVAAAGAIAVAAGPLIGGLLTFLLSQEVLGAAALQPIADEAIVATVSDLFLRGALPRPPGHEGAGPG